MKIMSKKELKYLFLLVFALAVLCFTCSQAQIRTGIVQRQRVITSGGADSQAPTTPTGLASSSITSSGFVVTWNASTDNIGVTGYKLYLNGTFQSNYSGTTATLSGLTQATVYSVKIAAYDGAGNLSAQSTALSVTTSSSTDTQAPTVPTGLASSNITSSGFIITWTASTDNVGVTGYNLYLNATYQGFYSSNTATVPGLSAGTTYSVTVSAKDAAGNFSAQSSALSVTTSGGASTLEKTAYLNFGWQYSTTVSNYNNFYTTSFPVASGTTYSSLILNDGSTSGGWGFTTTSSISGGGNSGSCSSGAYNTNALNSWWSISNTEVFTAKLTGLNTGKYYVLKFLCNTGSNVGQADFTINGTTVSVATINNCSNVAEFDNIVPNSSGEISFSLSRSTGYYQVGINVLDVEQYSAPYTPPVIPPPAGSIPVQAFQVFVETREGYENKATLIDEISTYNTGTPTTQFTPFNGGWNHPDMMDSVTIGIAIGKKYNFNKISWYDVSGVSCSNGYNFQVKRLNGYTTARGYREPIWTTVLSSAMTGSGWVDNTVSFTSDTLKLVIYADPSNKSNPGNFVNIPNEIVFFGTAYDGTAYPTDPSPTAYTPQTVDFKTCFVRQMDSPDGADIVGSRGYVASGYYSYGGTTVSSVNFSAPSNNSSHILGKYENIYRSGLSRNSYICSFNYPYWMNGTAESSFNFDAKSTSIINAPYNINSYRTYGQLMYKYANDLGMYVNQFQPLNEPQKTWQGRANYHGAWELFMLMSVSYDGHEKTFTDAGVKNARSGAKMFSSNHYVASLNQLDADRWLASLYRKDKKLPYDAYCIDTYISDVTTPFSVLGTKATFPEDRGTNSHYTLTNNIRNYIQKYVPGLWFVISEEGNDQPGSGSPQAAQAVSGQTGDYTNDAWKIRSYALVRADIYDHFQDRDGQPGGNYYYNTSGWSSDNYGGSTGTHANENYRTYRPMHYDMQAFVNRLSGFKEVEADRVTTGSVWKIHYVSSSNSNFHAYLVWSPTGNNTTVSNYSLSLAAGSTNAWTVSGWVSNSSTATVNTASVSAGATTISTVSEFPTLVYALNSSTFPTYFKYELQMDLTGKTITGTQASYLIDEQSKALQENPNMQKDWFQGYSPVGIGNFTLDLGGQYEVTRVLLQTSYTNAYTIQTSPDGTTWTTQTVTPKSVFYKNWSTYHIQNDCPTPGTCYGPHGQGVTCRYIKMIGSANIGEMAVYYYKYNNGQ